MEEIEEFERISKIRTFLTQASSSILTPIWSKKGVLTNTYLRFSFIAKVIEYLANKSIFHNIDSVHGNIIIEAICNTSWRLNYFENLNHLHLLLYEMSQKGLDLIEIEDLGTCTIPSIALKDGKLSRENIKMHKGFSYRLSKKGWESYRKQEFQILVANIYAARISRFVSYSALFLSLIAISLKIFS